MPYIATVAPEGSYHSYNIYNCIVIGMDIMSAAVTFIVERKAVHH